MLTVLLGMAIVFAGSYIAVKPSIKEWSYPDRGFAMFEKEWPKIFAGSYIVGALLATAIWFKTDYNTSAALIVGIITGLLAIAAWTDVHVFKVPSEISNLTIAISGAIAVVYIAFGGVSKLPLVYYTYLPYIKLEDFLMFAGICLGVGLIGFLGFLRIKSWSIAMFSLTITYLSVFLIGYALLSGLSLIAGTGYWQELVRAALLIYIFIGIVALFHLLFQDGIGMADIKIFYAIGLAFTWWFSAQLLFTALLIGFALQLILHIVAKPLDIGYKRTVPNKGIRKAYVGWKHARNVKSDPALVATEAPTTHVAQAVPFVPMLVLGVYAGLILFI